MREGTLALLIICKWLEIVALLVWSILTISQISLVIQIDHPSMIEERPQIFYPLILTAVLILYNLLFNNLLINLRFYCKMKCVTVGLCVYDACNYAQCECCLKKVCRDRCFTRWTIGKWILKLVVIYYTILALGEVV